MIMSKVGRLPGSSFIQILISFARCGAVPGGIDTRSPSVAIRMPASIGVSSAKGTSRVASSQMQMAKLHMSQASQLRSLRFFCNVSGLIQAG
uniref:Putative secreted protein n=1 Tax=Anopheles triannulatus TaxID=58253 RepID=A0A2M4B5M4_9DIPT